MSLLPSLAASVACQAECRRSADLAATAPFVLSVVVLVVPATVVSGSHLPGLGVHQHGLDALWSGNLNGDAGCASLLRHVGAHSAAAGLLLGRPDGLLERHLHGRQRCGISGLLLVVPIFRVGDPNGKQRRKAERHDWLDVHRVVSLIVELPPQIAKLCVEGLGSL
jgi:hypothetical protein